MAPEKEERSISIADLVDAISARLSISSESPEPVLSRHFLNSSRVQKLGLALSGFAGKIHRGRIQIYGNSERSYLARLTPVEIAAAYDRLDKENISCIVVTAGIEPTTELRAFAAENEVPLLTTPVASSDTIASVADVLAEALAPEQTVHGTLMNVFGIGVLILGESGIGKSECALDLISRGHRLISDDSVRVKRIGERIVGSAPENIRDYLEIRGLGIINARELFGVSALSPLAEIRFCIEFTELASAENFDRLGLDPVVETILAVEVQKYLVPVRPGRNLATLVEAAVRVFVSRLGGSSAVEKLMAQHNEAVAGKPSTIT
jgi:HPr kinase/phosphorylase